MPFVIRASDSQVQFPFIHPWSPSTQLTIKSLGDAVGLKRTGVHLVRIEAGKESFPLHTHHNEEEWLFVISGRAVAQIGNETYELAAGDFLGLPAQAPAHHVSNPFDSELVYLTGGERAQTDVADFPKLGKRLVRVGMKVAVHEIADGKPSPFAAFGFEPLAIK